MDIKKYTKINYAVFGLSLLLYLWYIVGNLIPILGLISGDPIGTAPLAILALGGLIALGTVFYMSVISLKDEVKKGKASVESLKNRLVLAVPSLIILVSIVILGSRLVAIL